MRRATSKRMKPVRSPPTSPPTWPPTEMYLDMLNVMNRLITRTPMMPLLRTGMPRDRSRARAAPMRPYTAPDAPTVSESGLTSRAPSDPATSEMK
jgi:hypothetical protein